MSRPFAVTGHDRPLQNIPAFIYAVYNYVHYIDNMKPPVEKMYEVIEQARRKKGYSKEQLSRALGYSGDWYENALLEKRELTLTEFLNICMEFQIPVPELMEKSL